ncbi:radial spoke head protein 6 homolog A isoform X1 [Nasonia vitripennis]|uniref:Uncharacterized protein n=1 Tax=Nasonia vitripennis TaxID=7425 RepID=A0A7M7H378_NASVI|nr:radial spoke head protein 6 homolog A isoform X1 [Nasonia vitripennis]
MAQSSYDINQVPPDDETPSVQRETEHAKLYLRKFCPEAGDSLYNHLSEVLSKIIAERPRNTLASFEEYSKKLRNDKFRSQTDRLRDLYVPPPQYEDARKLIDLFNVKIDLSLDQDNRSLEEENEDGDNQNSAPNLFDDMYYFEQVDIGLPRSEVVLLNLSIRKLMAKEKLEDVRFWGKILGRPKNYYIAEATLSEDEIERKLQELEEKDLKSEETKNVHAEEEANEQENAEKEALESALATEVPELTAENKAGSIENDSLKLVFPDIPKNTWKPTPDVAPEKLGTGVNSKVYYVCNFPGLDDWTELPTVTPRQIVVARQIIYLFTGNLETPIQTFLLFPGNEKNYLRAQIARIGAATHVSPIGYFTFGDREEEDEEIEEDEDEEETEGRVIVKNRHYEQPPLKDLIDPSMSSWCHHSPYILSQGRLEWLAPGKVNNEDEEEDDEEEGDEDEQDESEEGVSEKGESAREEEGRDKGLEKEIGPPLLTPLSEDAYNSDSVTPAWTARQSSTLQPHIAVALIRSNVWPGAFAFSANKKFANLYIGWGHKHHAYNYSPPAMPAMQEQHEPIGLEITEIQEPSFEEEEAYRLAHLPPPPPASDDAEEQRDEEETDEERDSED